VVIKNPDTAASYDQLKKCFSLFRLVAEHFESDAWMPVGLDLGLDRTWTVKGPHFYPPTGCQGGRPSETRTMWVPPGQDCGRTMRCLFHEFSERWLINVAGYDQSSPSGPADSRARHAQEQIPLDRCCPCSAAGGRQ